ncbi:MAG TPA: ABC transporter substrate-binding protein [Anaerolineales bacterium]|nr:ABC transporter substrate-binding protein [Anaerolineales bacterium]
MNNQSKRLYFVALALLILLLAACQTAAPETVASPTDPILEPTESVAATEEPLATEELAATEEMAATEEPDVQEPLVVLIDNDEGPITPANYNTFIGLWMVGWVYDSLFIRTPDLSTVPHLATSATPSEDGLTWTVTLRDDVLWHDGEPFTAEDVVFSYDFLLEAGRAPGLTNVTEVQAVGEHELEITLSSPNPFFLEEGLAATYIMPAHIWENETPISGELSQFQGLIGTGAYKLVDVVPGESYAFEANDDYFRGQPTVPSIIAKVVKDRTQQFNQLQSGAASAVLSSVPPALVEQLSENPDISLLQGSDFFNYILYANGSKAPFDIPEVRQAISLAVDTDLLVENVLLGQGTALPQNWYHPELPWSIDVPHEFDPEQAASLLDQAGLVDSDGDGVREFNGAPAEYTILCDVNNPVEVRTTELIGQMLGDVGLSVTQRCQDIDTSVAEIWPNFVAVPDPAYDLAIWGWSAIPQFRHGFIRGLFNCDFGGTGWGNLTGVCDEEVDSLLDEFTSLADLSRVDELSQGFQERFVEITPWVPLMSPNGNFAYVPEDYDGWVYLNGNGIMTVWSFLPPEASN